MWTMLPSPHLIVICDSSELKSQSYFVPGATAPKMHRVHHPESLPFVRPLLPSLHIGTKDVADQETPLWVVVKHELGHFFLQHSRDGASHFTRLWQEVEAWKWALSVTDRSLWPVVQRMAKSALKNYSEWARWEYNQDEEGPTMLELFRRFD